MIEIKTIILSLSFLLTTLNFASEDSEIELHKKFVLIKEQYIENSREIFLNEIEALRKNERSAAVSYCAAFLSFFNTNIVFITSSFYGGEFEDKKVSLFDFLLSEDYIAEVCDLEKTAVKIALVSNKFWKEIYRSVLNDKRGDLSDKNKNVRMMLTLSRSEVTQPLKC